MRYERDGEVTCITLDAEDTERAVLRAIVKASFCLASPEPGLSANGAEYQMTDEEADRFIRDKPRFYDGLVVEMNNVDARTCNTIVYKTDAGKFALLNNYYERFRGQPERMLERAKAELEAMRSSDGVVSVCVK